jgi:integrase
VRESGRKSFCIQYRWRGLDRRMTIKGVLGVEKARKQAKILLGYVAQGRDPLQERRKDEAGASDTLKAVCEEYLKRECGMKRGADGLASFNGKLRSARERWRTFERHVYPKLGSLPIGDVKRTDLVRLLDRIEDNSGASMADHTLAYLRRVFTWHASRSDEFRSPVVRGMARNKGQPRARILSDDELRVVWRTAEAFSGSYGHYIRFLLLTAARRNEAADLLYTEITNGDWLIPASRYKGRHDHLIPLSKASQAILAEAPVVVADQKYVFSSDGKSAISGFSQFKDLFDNAVLAELRKDDPRAEPLPNWTQHDLRRTARSLMSRAGVAPDTAERCLGHVIGGVRGTYDRYEYHAEKKQAFEALAALIERIINPRENVLSFDRSAGK